MCCLFGCVNSKPGWTDKTTKELWRNLPNNIDEGMIALDTLLSEKAKFHFQHTEESIAVIEICRDLGSTFISGWNLREKGGFYDGPEKKFDTWIQIHGLSTISNLSNYLNQYGIDDPLGMLRIIFTCYHQKLVNNFFDITEIINYYKSYWVKSTLVLLRNAGSPTPNIWELNSKIKKRDDSLLNKYFFDKANVSDTLTSMFFYENHRFTSKPLSYNIEAIVFEKDSVRNILDCKIMSISSRKKSAVWYDDKIKKEVGDTLEIRASKWDNKRTPEFYYY